MTRAKSNPENVSGFLTVVSELRGDLGFKRDDP